MQRIYVMIVPCFISITLLAQTDSTRRDSIRTTQTDTIRIGGMIIIKKDSPDQRRRQTTVTIGNHESQKHSNVNTAQFIIDIGYANWNDKTDYALAASQLFTVNKPGSSQLNAEDFKFKPQRSSNVNIWIGMQRLNLIRHYVNLKYGIGVEFNNYRFKTNISFKESATNPYNSSQNINHAFIIRDSISFSKNKLAADYITLPFMLNFRTDPNYPKKGLSFSAGVSMGYLYNSRNKQKSDERGKVKNRGDYDLEKWKFSYIGELGLGFIQLYGSYAPKSIFKNGLNVMPYNIGIRFSNL